MGPLIDQLIQQGVRDFGLCPGSRSTPLAIAIARHPGARLHRHFDERGLGFYALGMATGSERPVAILVTSGTAVGNLLPAVMEAHHASTPLLVLTADRPAELRENSANQTSDQTKIFQNFVRWQFEFDPTITEPAIRSHAVQAVSRCVYPHPGPVHLNCPFREPLYKDVACEEGWPMPLHFAPSAPLPVRSLPPRGIILIGRLPRRADIHAVLALANRLQWPVLADLLSGARIYKTAEQIRHFDWFTHHTPPDCVLHFGERLTSKRFMEWLGAMRLASYIHISQLNHWCDSWHLQTERIYADTATACNSLHAHAIDPTWLASWKTRDALNLPTSQHLTETSAMQFLSQLDLSKWAIFLGASMPIREADWFLFPKACHGFFANRGLSGIDGNIATAAGLAVGLQTGVLAVLGDVATLHDLNSLALLRNTKHPVVLLIWNNDGCGIFSHLPVAKDPHFETLFGFAHGLTFEMAARQFQIPYFFAEEQGAYLEAMQQALQSNQSCIVEIKTSREKNFAHHQMMRAQ